MLRLVFSVVFSLVCTAVFAQQVVQTQVLVAGGTTGGIAAGLQSARSGAKTIIVEETTMLGGMLTAAGVSCTDGNHNLQSGIWQQFREALYTHYGTRNLASGWVSNNCFEPHVADSIFKAWAKQEPNLTVYYGWFTDSVFTKNNKVTAVRFVNTAGETLLVKASVTIDATEMGDVYAMAGAGYDIGMESPAYSGEQEAIEKNNIIQDLTWAAVLKDYGKGNDHSIAKPAGYDASKFYCSTADAPCNGKPYSLNTQKVLDYGRLTSTDSLHPKYMLNWPAHGNDEYLDVIEVKPIKRLALYEPAKNKTLGFIYFLQQQLGYKNIGLASDELNDGMALMPYNREGRRLKGVIRFNINHIKNPFSYSLYKTGIAVGDYPVDHHHGQYPGHVPEIDFPKVPSFSIPLGAQVPEKIDGLIVCEKGISVSNIANGSTRLQPVVLLTGQAAGIAAALCIRRQIQPRQLNVRQVQAELLQNKAYLQPYYDIRPDDNAWQAMQVCGVLGIIKGVGKSEAWENKMYCYPDSTLHGDELEENLTALMQSETVLLDTMLVSVASLAEKINRFNQFYSTKSTAVKNKIKTITPGELGSSFGIKDVNAALNRKTICSMLEKYLLAVKYAVVDLQGNISF